MVPTNDLLLRVLAGELTERPPVWLMRQAGRILKEYREVRASVNGFKALVSNPELASEVTVQPVDILGVDAAILFSDILVIPEAMGLDYQLIEKVGPRFPVTIKESADIDRLRQGDEAAGRLGYVYDAITATRAKLANRVPLIGFAGAPWTLLSYMVEGGGSKTFSKAKAFLYGRPAYAHRFLEKITRTLIAYLQQKVASGVHVLQLFDSWAGVLDRPTYEEFGLRYIRQILEALPEVPVIMFSKGAWFSLDQLAALPATALGLDWQTSPAHARSIAGPDRVLQGNLDPSLLLSNVETIQHSTKDMLAAFGRHHIANLGHGVYPDTPVEHVKCFIQAVQSYDYGS